MAKITITIDKKANIHTDIEGIKGAKCTKVDSFLTSLGDAKFAKTSSFYDSAQPSDVFIVGQGGGQ